MKKKNTQFHKGFTLVEALVAVSILSISITALLSIVGQNIFLSNYVKNRSTALGLAQEGVELVRNIQDTALLSTSYNDFDAFIQNVFGPCVGTGVCRIDPLDLSISSCDQDFCPPLNISPNGYFSYSPFEDTDNPSNARFTRYISIVPTGQKSGRATVRVEWQQGQAVREVVYEADLFLWID